MKKNYIISKFITLENIIFSIFEKNLIYNFQIKKLINFRNFYDFFFGIFL